MTAPTPGPGWTELAAGDPVPDGAELLTWDPRVDDADAPARRWVLIPPRPLPTAPGTVIAVDDPDLSGTWTLTVNGWRRDNDPGHVPADVLSARLTAWHTLAAPPAVTASAVLADVAAAPNSGDIDLTPIAAAYGVALPTANE